MQDFTDTLLLPTRGKLNLGHNSIGKTSAVRELLDALTAIDNHERVTGKYAPAVKEYYSRLMSKPRGDIVALWNPEEYTVPLVFRSKETGVTERIVEDINPWMNAYVNEAADIFKQLLLRELSFGTLLNFQQTAKEKYGEFSWNLEYKEHGFVEKCFVVE